MDQADRQAQLRRRGILTGLAALVGAALAKGGEKVAQAADGGNFILGSTANQANNETTLTRGAGTPSSTNYALHVWGSNDHAGIFGESSHDGLHGYTSDTTNTFSGTYGQAGAAGPNYYGTAGVHGNSQNYPGVIGNSGTKSAVIGLQGNSVSVPPGVAGVVGASNSNVGVRGQSTSSYGVFGASTNSTGVGGNSPNYIGVYGQTNGGVGVWGSGSSGYGLYGVSTSGIGIYGSSGSYIGVSASSGTSTALFAASNSGLAAYFQGPVQVQGNFTVLPGFAKSVAVPHPDGSTRRMYCMESPESYFEDFGRGQLASGRASVRLDQDFAAVVRNEDYDVFLTPKGDCNGLYVSSQSSTGFEVRELKGGTSSLAFSYRVVAKRKDIAGPRMERVDLSTRPERPARPGIQEPGAPPPAPPLEQQPATGTRRSPDGPLEPR